MSVSGVSGDALAAAARYRANTDQGFGKPPVGGDDKLLQDAVLTRIRLDQDDYDGAERKVRRLANRHDCRPVSRPGECPDLAAHGQDQADMSIALLALFQPMRKTKIERTSSRAQP